MFAQLLNTTVASMAISVNTVLTSCYHAVFGENSGHTDQDELMLVTAPLSAASEVQGLYEKGIIDAETAIPAALHSLGCSANEITEALKRMRSQKDSNSLVESNTFESDKDLKKAQTEHTRAQTLLVKAQTKRTNVDVEMTNTQAYDKNDILKEKDDESSLQGKKKKNKDEE